MKRLFTALFIFTNLVLTAQTLLSPSIFLGYELGSRFTPHHKIEAYFQMAAQAAVQQIMGRGNVVYFTEDPLFRSFWENEKLMFTNAVFFVGQ